MIKLLLTLVLTTCSLAAQVPRNCTQAIVGITNGWNSSHVTLAIYQKHGRRWKKIGTSWRGRIGRRGLAWGYGLHPPPPATPPGRKEGEGPPPAGQFKIGGAYGWAAPPALKYRRVTTRDLWVEDKKSHVYNRHVVLKHEPTAAWEKKAQMRQGDYAHALKLYIGHNDAMLGGHPIPGLGSAIFFHIWRGGGSKATAGCTTMPKSQLQKLIATIDPTRHPVYILLPESEYKKLRSPWRLP